MLTKESGKEVCKHTATRVLLVKTYLSRTLGRPKSYIRMNGSKEIWFAQDVENVGTCLANIRSTSAKIAWKSLVVAALISM